jgi:general secretion pathway protein A
LYKTFYGLKDNPFRLTPDPAFMCLTAQHREALSGLVHSIFARLGLTVLVGEAGTGKTTLIYSLLELLQKRRCVVALCNNPTLTREEFYDLLLIKLRVECSSTLKSRQLAALQDALMRNRQEGKTSLLIVDEAQRLSPALLEEIRLLLNLETPTEKLLHIIIAGQPELSDVLRRPELRQFKQRVSCFCKLEPLSRDDLSEYLRHRLARAGYSGVGLFDPPLVDRIYAHTGGIPRLANALCDSSLQIGFALQSPTVTLAILDEAARDLELAPAPAEQQAVAQARFPSPVVPSSAAVALAAAASVAPSASPAAPGRNGAPGARVPLENYSSRQNSWGVFAKLMERLR